MESDHKKPQLDNPQTEAAAQRRVTDAWTAPAASSGHAGEAGVPSSNTTPANCTVSDHTRILRVGPFPEPRLTASSSHWKP